jgi:hypothetical protein
VTIACSQFLRVSDRPRWVVLLDCEVRPDEAVRAKTQSVLTDEAYFLPVRPKGSTSEQTG